jgi:hypothetical protein
MQTYWICFTLASDATFGRGEGLAGVVDQEIDHDELGLPRLDGRTLKGLLNEECANLLFGLKRAGVDMATWTKAAGCLFGRPGSGLADGALLHVGPALLPAALREVVRQEVESTATPLEPAQVLDSLTAVRRQTAVDEGSGAPDEHTLRAMRVILRGTPFQARLEFDLVPDVEDVPLLPLLAASVLGLRRAGTGRNRGRGRLVATLHENADGIPGQDVTRERFDDFCQEVER